MANGIARTTDRSGSWQLGRLTTPTFIRDHARSISLSTGTAAQAAPLDPDGRATAVDRERQGAEKMEALPHKFIMEKQINHNQVLMASIGMGKALMIS
jgi:hypothetical protein